MTDSQKIDYLIWLPELAKQITDFIDFLRPHFKDFSAEAEIRKYLYKIPLRGSKIKIKNHEKGQSEGYLHKDDVLKPFNRVRFMTISALQSLLLVSVRSEPKKVLRLTTQYQIGNGSTNNALTRYEWLEQTPDGSEGLPTDVYHRDSESDYKNLNHWSLVASIFNNTANIYSSGSCTMSLKLTPAGEILRLLGVLKPTSSGSDTKVIDSFCFDLSKLC
jgi:hypothetical protein